MKTIVITGVSSGLGRVAADEALARGHRVIGTVRKEEQRRAFEASVPDRAFGYLLDVTDIESMPYLIDSIEEDVGPIDVLINNAGYGLRGVVEELDLDALRHQFEVNLFSAIALIQYVLPTMRRRGAGHIVNIASMGGMIAFPGLGAYHGTKFATIGMSDSLDQEVRPLGIHVTSVLPGLYDTDWRGRSMDEAEHRVSDYDALLGQNRELNWGNPSAFARVLIDAIELREPPKHLLVGPTSVEQIRARLAEWTSEIDQWITLSQAEGEG